MILKNLLWPLARLGEGMAALAARAGLQPVQGEVLAAPAPQAAAADLPRWVEWAGARLGIDEPTLRSVNPGLVHV